MNKSKIGLLSLLAILFGIFSSCEEENNISPSLVTEEVIYLSGERARLLGRIITTQNINASDHGFYIAENESFNQPMIISLGERITPGRFIGETDALNIERSYFAKSFINVGGEIQFGNVLQLTTLSPEVQSFLPNNGPVGTIITLTGKNFTSDTRILIGNRPAEIQNIEFESRITARIPAAGSVAKENVTVIVQGKEFVLSQQFEYTTGSFLKLQNPPASVRFIDNIFFQDNENFYLGLGTDANQVVSSKMWKYSLGNEQWTEVPFQGNALWLAFHTNNYFGGGGMLASRAPYTTSRDFWSIQNGAFEKLPDLPFECINAISFETNENLYVFGGILNDNSYKYSKSQGNWESITSTPFSVDNSLLHFQHDNKFYIITPFDRTIFSFDPGTETWNEFGFYPGDIVGGSGFGVTIGDNVYLGMNNRSVQVWQLNMVTKNWIKKNDFNGISAALNVGVYSNDGFIYLARRIESNNQMEFWRFDPNGL
ncbi:IPT/TIG domain-containing protein [Aquiflexum sp.]|uniref:IPT/TIG domain-containing protein n=1 Tax=Aquiflexum sp. TaxID=1872584 RepID=UPI00359416EC